MIPSKASDDRKVPVTQTTPSALMAIGELQRPVSNDHVLSAELGLVAIAGLAKTIGNAGKAYTDSVFLDAFKAISRRADGLKASPQQPTA